MPSDPRFFYMANPLEITASVGAGGRNLPGDVEAVQARLFDLGFGFGGIDRDAGPATARAIRLFQSVIYGRQTLGGDGRVDVGMMTHRWLEAGNAPKWIEMPARGIGFINIEREQDWDHHDWGTSWLDETIRAAASVYHVRYQDDESASLMCINDVSLEEGGDTPDHAGHECGMSTDPRLPVKDGTNPPGVTWEDDRYDREAMREQLKALWDQDYVSRIFFNDPVLAADEYRGRALCKVVTGHDNHAHVEREPPARI